MEKNFEWRDTLDFGTCQRADGTYYGHGGAKCHKGAEATLPSRVASHKVFSRLSVEQSAKLTQTLLNFETKLTNAGYQEDALEDWRDAQTQMLSALNNTGSDKGTGKYAYTEEEIVAKAAQQLNKANDLMVGKMPTYLDNNAGEFTPASLSMTPDIGASQLKWKDPVLGDKYGNYQVTREKAIKDADKKASKMEKAGDKASAKLYRERAERLKELPNGATIVTKNGVAPSRFSQWQEGNAAKALAYKAKLESEGKTWPPAPSRVPTKQEVDDLVKANPNMWTSGFNNQNKGRGRDDAFDVYEANSKNPSPQALAARENKNRAMAESYLSYNGKSPATGQAIQVPKAGLPSTKTVVDHVDAYRNIVEKNPSKNIFELDAIANTRSNFMVVESDINNSKGDRTWAQTAVILKRGQNDEAVRKSVTDSWNERGGRVTLSRREYEARVGSLKGFESPAERQRIGSAYEQSRLAKVFGTKQEDMVPTQRNRNSRPVSDGFTSSKDSAPTVKAGVAVTKPIAGPKTPTPKPARAKRVAPAVKTRVKAAPVPKAKLDPKRVSAAIAQQKAALQQAKKDKRSGDVKALESTIKMLEAAL